MRNIIVYLFCILQITLSVDFYEILGVSKDAKEQEIKKAFRQLSKEYHPDRRPGDQAAQARFMEINRAYEVLSDPEQRKRYDIFGEADMNKQRPRGPDQTFQLSVSLEEVYVGAVKTITVQQKRQVCRQCKGTGARDGKTQPCQNCGGRGVVIEKVNFGFVQMNTQNPCRQCGGTGKTFTSWCPVCRGQKVVTLNKNFDVEIEQGMDTGSTILFKGEGDESPDWNSGDLIFQLQVMSHNKFTRRGTNLYTTETLSIKEALLTYDKQINHLDNHKVQIKYDGITQPNSTRIIQSEGMPTHKFPSQRGNLFVTFIVQLPKTLSARQKELLVTFFES